MKKTLLIIVFIFSIFQFNLYSQWGWFQVQSGVNNNLNDFCYHYGVIWIAGDNGLILKSTNSGTNWSSQPSGTTADLKAIDFEFSWWSQHRGMIVGANGTILLTTNDGANWVLKNSGVTATLRDCIVNRNDSNTIVAVGDSGKVVKSTDCGSTWQVRTCPVNVSLNHLAQGTASDLCAVGAGGVVLVSFGFGDYWSVVQSGTGNDLNSITQYTNIFANMLAAGNNGTILKTSNGGNSWQPVNSGTTQNILSIFKDDNGDPMNINYLFASGASGTILSSVDQGNSWQSEYCPVSQNLNSIALEYYNTGIAVGNNGTIVQTKSNYYYIDSKKMDANTISTPFTNGGSFDSKLEWPKGTGKNLSFGSGIWIGAMVNSELRVAVPQYDMYEYYSGYTDNSGVPHGRNDSNYRIYKITYGSAGIDRQRWPNSMIGNSDQGAPVYYDSASSSWRPLDFGSQTMFYSYTDAYPEAHNNGFCGQTDPLKADIKQLNFALDVAGAMGNVIISQFNIINRSNSVWSNAYFTVWSDHDIGDPLNDKVGCDSSLALGFSYNGSGNDTAYGSSPPAIGFLMLKGARNFTGNNSDTIFFCRNKSNQYLTKYKDLSMAAFNMSINGDITYPDPFSPEEAYNLMKGLNYNGTQIYNPLGFYTKLIYSGNPVSGNGWNQTFGGDVRSYISTGPVNLNPGDTQIIVTAQIIARGNTALNSISLLKEYAAQVKQYYRSCYTSIPIGIKEDITEVPGKFLLYQNYPNPFNPTTHFRFEIAELGYAKLTIYDALGREVTTLVNEQLRPGIYEAEWDGSNYSSGVYYYKLLAGSFTQTRKMVLIR